MTYIVHSPGVCGEFIQGIFNGQNFLISCPIAKFSSAMIESPLKMKAIPNYFLAKAKGKEAFIRGKDFMSIIEHIKQPYIDSSLMEEKGFGSSTADITAILKGLSLTYKKNLSLESIAAIATQIEPTNSSFIPGLCRFDHVRGHILERWNYCPPFTILIFDTGGTINTIQFNKEKNLKIVNREKEAYIEEALFYFRKGIKEHKPKEIAKASTISAFQHQKILYKIHLEELYEVASYYGAEGVVVAHSGTIIGVLFNPSSTEINHCKIELIKRFPQILFVDCVDTYYKGLSYEKI